MAKCKRAAKAAVKSSTATHSEALEEQAILAGYPSWRDLLAAHEAHLSAQLEPSASLPLDPTLPKDFYDTANEDRPERDIAKWWDVPYAVTMPDGSLDVRCLDGGAWDRPTFYGRAPGMEAASKLAAETLSKWIAMRSRPVASMADDGQFEAVVMPQRPGEEPKRLAGPMSAPDLGKWMESWKC